MEHEDIPVQNMVHKSLTEENTSNDGTNSNIVVKIEDITHACNEYLAEDENTKESFICGVCNFDFYSVSQLHNHLKLVHSPKKYTFYLTLGTAYPDLELECRYTQTDSRDVIHDKEVFDVETDNNEDSIEIESFSDALSCDNKSSVDCIDKFNNLGTTYISLNTDKDDLELCKKSGEKCHSNCKRDLEEELNKFEGNADLKQDVTVATDNFKCSKRSKIHCNNYFSVNSTENLYGAEDNTVFKQNVPTATEIFGNLEVYLSTNSSNQNLEFNSDVLSDVSFDQETSKDKDTDLHSNMGRNLKRKKAVKYTTNVSTKDLKSVVTKNQDRTVTSAKGNDEKLTFAYECDQCNTKYPSVRRLQYHIMKVHSKISDTLKKECVRCGLTLQGERSYLAHIRQCNRNENLICFVCSESFATKLEVLEHLVSHKNSQDFSCKYCKRTFNNEVRLQRHLCRYNQPRNLQCEHCGKAFSYPYQLTRHLESCNRGSELKCDQCEMKFKTTRTLDDHKIVHSTERPFLCHICGYAVKRSAYLTRHIRIHTGERPYPCSECGIRFSALTDLHKHKKIHSNDKPYKCTYCEKSFITNWNLKTHLRQHTGDTPYKCDICGKAFKQNVLLKLHLKTHP